MTPTLTENQAAVLALLGDGKSRTHREIAEALAANRTSIQTTVRQLYHQGRVGRDDRRKGVLQWFQQADVEGQVEREADLQGLSARLLSWIKERPKSRATLIALKGWAQEWGIAWKTAGAALSYLKLCGYLERQKHGYKYRYAVEPRPPVAPPLPPPPPPVKSVVDVPKAEAPDSLDAMIAKEETTIAHLKAKIAGHQRELDEKKKRKLDALRIERLALQAQWESLL